MQKQKKKPYFLSELRKHYGPYVTYVVGARDTIFLIRPSISVIRDGEVFTVSEGVRPGDAHFFGIYVTTDCITEKSLAQTSTYGGALDAVEVYMQATFAGRSL